MKYLIQDTDSHTLGEINSYFKQELFKTSLIKEDIIVDKNLQKKIAIVELERILDENGLSEKYEISLSGIHLNLTGHTIELSENELSARFDDAYECMLTGLIYLVSTC